jgi:hypothetical protein
MMRSYNYQRCLILLITLWMLPSASHSEVVPFGDLSLGLGVQTLSDSDEGAVGYVSKAGVGLQLLPFISVQASLWAWGSNNNQSTESSEDDETDNMSFESLGVSWEATLQLPFPNPKSDFRSGPYYRFGKQCWSAVLSGVLQPWSGRGCNDLHAIGLVFPSTRKTRAALYIEALQTNFDNLESDSIQVGVKIPL